MSDQLAMFDAPAVACTRTLVDLARDVARSPTLPLWAAVAGEAWFARAWAACDRWLALLASAAWGWDAGIDWWVENLHLAPCLDAIRGDTERALTFTPCAECAAAVRREVGAVSLDMLRVGFERRKAGRR